MTLGGVALGLVASAVFGWPEVPPPATTCAAPETAGIVTPWVSIVEAERLRQQGAVFADARELGAFEAGHVAGALPVPMDAGAYPHEMLPLLQGAATLIVYCDTSASCAASTQLAGLLAAEGFGDVRVLEGGFPAWMDAELPAEAGPCEGCP